MSDPDQQRFYTKEHESEDRIRSSERSDIPKREKSFYSVVIPVYNEEESLEILCREIMAVFTDLKGDLEIVFVNDGSTDQSARILQSLVNMYQPRVRVITCPQRVGQTAAIKMGLDAVAGETVITLDGDLQNDPADIPLLIERLEQGYDVVCGWRRARRDKPLKIFLSCLANGLQRTLTGLPIHDISCTLRAYRRECLGRLILSRAGEHRYIPLILALGGYRIAEVVCHHRPRRYGYSKYSHKRALKVIIDFGRIFWAYRNSTLEKKK